jgi:hypothetical protein
MKSFLYSIVCAFLLALFSSAQAQPQSYQTLGPAERQGYVKAKAHQIAAAVSGRITEFSPAFLALVTTQVDRFADRVGNNLPESSGREDFRRVLERGVQLAPAFSRIFQGRQLSPLLGLYLPLMESEYRSESTSPAGSLGMFQFIEPTAVRFGLKPEERADPLKSADAAARYLAESKTRFSGDVWLALLAYNQGENAVEQLLGAVAEARGSRCSVCKLIEKKESLGPKFRGEGETYVPAFFAAAILGEFPQDFGLSARPLSSY